MAIPGIQLADYPIKAFIDANIILECKPLKDLPWDEIDTQGPILVLLTPQVLKEVDSKKQDGRLSRIAREFNGSLSPILAGQGPLIIRESGPRVVMTLAPAVKIPWDQHDDLDPNDGDSRVVAEILYAKDIGDSKLLISHDMKPLGLAYMNGVAARCITDAWLRPPSPGKQDREIQRLQQRVRELEATQPSLGLELALLAPMPVTIYRIAALTISEQRQVRDRIFELNPEYVPDRSHGLWGLNRTDTDYPDRYESYRQRVGKFAARFSHYVEEWFNQQVFSLTVRNDGNVPAKDLKIDIKVTGGWISDRHVIAKPTGPRPPRPSTNPLENIRTLSDMISDRVDRHEFDLKKAAPRNSSLVMTCEDFRTGAPHTFHGAAGIDATSPEPTKVAVALSASNSTTPINQELVIAREVRDSHASDFIELQTLRLLKPTPMEDNIKNGLPEMGVYVDKLKEDADG